MNLFFDFSFKIVFWFNSEMNGILLLSKSIYFCMNSTKTLFTFCQNNWINDWFEPKLKSMGLCVCKERSKRQNSRNNVINNNTDSRNGSRSRAAGHQSTTNSVNEVTEECINRGSVMANDVLTASNGTNHSKLSSMVDKLILETLSLIRTLVDK